MRRIFIISDLHLGGRPDQTAASGKLVPGFQICHAYAELIEFIDWVSREAGQGDEEIELVINGDIVDFLAEDDFADPALGAKIWTADPLQVIQKLDRVMERTRGASGRGVFEALADLAKKHRLTLLLGNHDVELGLPQVRRHLCQKIDPKPGCLSFIYDGEAYTIGRLLIEHGNRYDRWNMINHSGLRQERSMHSRGLPVSEDLRERLYFLPPAGTHLVIHFMNRIKARYRFVDLLKPEDSAVIPLLLALEPDFWPDLEDIIQARPLISALAEHGLASPVLPRLAGDLANPSDEADKYPTTLNGVLREALGAEADFLLPPQVTAAGDMSMRDSLYDAARWLKVRTEQIGEVGSSLFLLTKQKFASNREQRLRRLHAALRHLNQRDASFDLRTEKPSYRDAARITLEGGSFDAVVYGHTHLPKQVEMVFGERKGIYLNSGTWSDVMRLPAALSEDFNTAQGELERFWNAIRDNNFSPYIKRYLSYVEVLLDQDEGSIRQADLRSFCGAEQPRAEPLTSIHPS